MVGSTSRRRTLLPLRSVKYWISFHFLDKKAKRGRRRKKLLDDLKDRRGYCQLKEEALNRTMWRNRFGRGSGPVV